MEHALETFSPVAVALKQRNSTDRRLGKSLKEVLKASDLKLQFVFGWTTGGFSSFALLD